MEFLHSMVSALQELVGKGGRSKVMKPLELSFLNIIPKMFLKFLDRRIKRSVLVFRKVV